MSTRQEQSVNIIFIIGACRSGKTTIGKLLGSSHNSEFVDEPLLLVNLPIIMRNQDQNKVSELFKLYLDELIHDVVLMRRSNFRPYDLSSVLKTTSPEEIFDRFSLRRKVDAARYIKDNGFTVIISLPDNIENTHLIKNIVPSSRIITVVRDGLTVASLIEEKGWFSNQQLIESFNNTATRNFKFMENRFKIPWWVVEHEEEYFLSLSEYDRSLYYWCQINTKTRILKNMKDVLFQRFEDFIDDVDSAKSKLMKFSGVKESDMTCMILSSILSYAEDNTFKKYKINKTIYNRYLEITGELYG